MKIDFNDFSTITDLNTIDESKKIINIETIICHNTIKYYRVLWYKNE